jgi:hypothetical protein
MLGAITGGDGQVQIVGASANFPPPDFDFKAFNVQAKQRRRTFLGETLYQYDEYIQNIINSHAEKEIPTTLPSDMQNTYSRLSGHPWLVFRCNPRHQENYPHHFEPRCSK